MAGKKVGGAPGPSYGLTDGLQTVDYTYNVRGWLKRINDPSDLGSDLFAFGINYNTVSHGGTPLFNGNISETEWRTANTDNSLKWYRYGYDPLNRITAGIDNTGQYNLSGVAYDKNGNIRTLQRQGWTIADPLLATNTGLGMMDDLVYSYLPNSNKLMKVADGAANDQFGFRDDAVNTMADNTDDYEYDGNGNLTSDLNKGITNIEYNHLNLPTDIVTGSGTISYVYDATGTKLQKSVSGGGSVTDYAGNFVYKDGTLQFFGHPEGYVSPDGMGGYDYVYQYRDHLGNIRLSYTDANGDGSIDASTEIIEENNYYPFGLQHKGYNNVKNGAENPYKYHGKELVEDLGYNMYDFDLRHYDPAIARWVVVDPLADIAEAWTPYHFVRGNPINRIDPTGLTDFALNKKTGDITQVGDANDDPDRIVKTDKNGNVKRKGEGFLGFLVKKENRGEAKVALGGIEKGILADGQNFKTDDQVINVGGEGQASLAGVEDFVTRFSEHVGVEIAGAYLSQQDGANAPISKVFIDEYQGNKPKQSSMTHTRLFTDPSLAGFNTITAFHTHPTNIGASRIDIERPSGVHDGGGDIRFRNNQRSYFYNFLILTRTANYPYGVQRIPYTNWNR